MSVVGDERLHTHGRTIRSARKAILDVIELWHQVPEGDVELEETYDLGDVAPAVEVAREARAAAAAARAAASARSVEAARQLADAGISRRDSAEILGYTFQRVQQLVAEGKVEPSPKQLERRQQLEG